MKIVFTNGCFDILHPGHIELFKYARSLGDELIVGIDSDRRVNTRKPNRPINLAYSRKHILESIRYIDQVKIFDTDDELKLLVKEISPDIMIVGSDWKDKPVIGSEYAKELKFFNRIENYSTTEIVKRIIGGGNLHG